MKMSDIEYEVPEVYQNNSEINSRDLYINEIYKYPLLSKEEEKKYGYMLLNKDNKKLLVINEVDGYVKPSLNTGLLFYSLINNSSYKSIIDDLIKFYGELDSSSDKVIDILRKYQGESNKVGRALDINELSSIFNITNSEKELSEKELLYEIKEFMNYKLAFKKMFDSNLRLVVSIASKFKNNIDIMDLIAEGNLGLMKAIVGFDISLGYKFSTYATRCIKQTIKRYVYSHNMAVRIPECVGSDISVFRRRLEKLEQEENRSLRIDEIAEKLDLPVEQVTKYLIYMLDDVSLDDFISEDDSLTMRDIIPSDVNVEEEVMAEFLKKDILDFLDVLNERYQDVIKMKYGLAEYNGEKHTMREIAKKHSISQQRVTEMFYKSLYLMRKSTRQRGKQKSLIDYYYNQ